MPHIECPVLGQESEIGHGLANRMVGTVRLRNTRVCDHLAVDAGIAYHTMTEEPEDVDGVAGRSMHDFCPPSRCLSEVPVEGFQTDSRRVIELCVHPRPVRPRR